MTEDQLEQEMLGWLSEIGYTPIYGPEIAPDGDTPERSNYQEVLLIERLRKAIARLNPDIPLVAREDALNQVRNLNTPVMLSANRLFHNLLVNGVKVDYQKDGETRGDFVRLVDFENPSQNEWLAINQFSIQGEKHTRRPDVILFINGLPLVLVELKNPADENADIWKAFQQIDTYKEQIPDIFQYNEIVIISDGSSARMGSLSADEERFMPWRTIDGVTLDPLDKFNELETLTRGMLTPSYLLDYVQFFILFEDDREITKKIAGYHQFHAVRAAIDKTITASRQGGNKKGGVVWHTQGSGKSMTMTCFAARVMRDPVMENPTIVVINDRTNLDGQLWGVFSLSEDLLRGRPIQVETRQDLRIQLNDRPSGGIVFSTIQKFMPGEDEDIFPLLSDRRNIVVIADEAHRTQYGFSAKLIGKLGQEKYSAGYAQHLRDALPNATFVAFTGTPVSTGDRDTRAVFGDYIHIYDIQQAKEDGATVGIYYQSRLAKLSLDQNEMLTLDEEVEELTEGEEDSEQAKLKSRWAALEKIVGAEPRIQQVATDLVSHYEERCKAQYGKAMIVGMSRDICVHLYDAIVALRPEWHSDDPTKGSIKVVITGSASDKPLLRPHIYAQQVRKDLEKRFKNPEDTLRLLIVRDMWLTGFDVPCAHTLYVDKPMKSHNLMQAITRVNRVFKNKESGLIVDYIGITNNLKEASRDYTASQGRGQPVIDVHEAYTILKEKLDLLRGMLHGFDYSNFLTGGRRLVAKAANHILGIPDGKKRFADTALALLKASTLCSTLDEVKTIRDEVAFMKNIKIILTKPDISAKKQRNEERELAIRQIISSAVVSNQVVDIFDAVGLDKPNIGILDEAFLAEVRNLPEKNLAVELLERLLEGEIRTRFVTNVIQEKKFSELLADTIRRYQNRAIETAQVMEELCEMAKKFKEAIQRGESVGLNEDELAFYDALANNEASVKELGDETLKKIAHELTENLRKNTSVDWHVRENVQAKLRLMVRGILRKYKYPPDKQEEAIILVLKQAETLSARWVQTKIS
jgi:type I restriction enzyme R subunit